MPEDRTVLPEHRSRLTWPLTEPVAVEEVALSSDNKNDGVSDSAKSPTVKR